MTSERFPPKQQRPPASAAEAAQRLATIVDAAERAASSVIDDAEVQARQHLEEARARADRIVAERLREMADQLREMADQLDAVGQLDLSSAEEVSEDENGKRRDLHLRPVETDAEADGKSHASRNSGSAGARLLATQMAVSGASRKEIDMRLRSGFEIEDTSEILEAILGPED
jgi:vacuolar-type H+-ATPase subunit H